MHGLTKEIFKLVRAARAFDRAWSDTEGAKTGDLDPGRYLAAGALAGEPRDYDSEAVYFAVLADLARALAGGRSLDKFRDLWLDDGDMEELLAGHALFPWGRGKMLSKLAEPVARLGWHPEEALLSGDLMCRLLYQALDEMEQVEQPLVRPEESLDLFVTATNVHGYDTVIPTGAGGVSHTDKSYRQLMRFSYQNEPPPAARRFASDLSDVAALTFAARATSSFPGALVHGRRRGGASSTAGWWPTPRCWRSNSARSTCRSGCGGPNSSCRASTSCSRTPAAAGTAIWRR